MEGKRETPVTERATLREGITPRILGEGSGFRQAVTDVAQPLLPFRKIAAVAGETVYAPSGKTP
jgi:hypothetical protein